MTAARKIAGIQALGYAKKGGNDSFYLKPKIQEKMHETCQIVTKLEGEIINFLILLDSLTETDEK